MPQNTKRVKRKRIVKRKTSKCKVSKRTRTSYSIEQKELVVNYAKIHGRNSAATHFGLNKSMVRRWIKANTNWKGEVNRNSKSVGSDRKVFYPEAEKRLYNWIIEQRKQGLAVTYSIIRVKMLDILKEPDIIVLYGNITNFKLSNRWLYAFMRRQRLSLRRRTKIVQKLLKQIEESLEKFHQFITRLRIEKSYEMSHIFNMDETPVWFDMAGNFSVNQTGEKTVHIRGTGNEKNRFTVVLTCAAGRNIKFFFRFCFKSEFIILYNHF